MPGFSTDSNDPTKTVVYADNVQFDGSDSPGSVTLDGQLLIGSTTEPHIRVGNLISSDGSIEISNLSGSIDIRGEASGFQPNAVVQIFDDFITNSGSTSPGIGQLGWALIGSGEHINTNSENNPGIYAIKDNGVSGIVLSNTISTLTEGSFLLGGGQLVFNFNLKLTSLSTGINRYVVNIGMTDTTQAGIAPDNGIYFSYSDNVNSGNWVINCENGGVVSSTNTSNAADTGYHTYTFVVNADGTSVTFYIDNGVVGTINTNIPSSVIQPIIYTVRSIGTMPDIYADLFWLTQSLSNIRPGGTNPSISGNNGTFLGNYIATAISYQMLSTDAIIGVTSTAAPRTITMPSTSMSVGQLWTIKDESGGAGTNNITISGNGYNVDGSATYVINNNYGSIDIYWNGSAFFIS